METINECFICGNSSFSSFIKCTDHTVSKEDFSIVQCDNCGFKFTNPRPDEEELGKYYQSEEYISHSNTNKGLINKIYHFVRKYTLSKKLRLINSLSDVNPHTSRVLGIGVGVNKILDIGCGTGEFLHTCKQNGWDAYGIEPDEKARNSAIENYGLNVKREDEIKFLKNNSFNIITLWHVLEHISKINELSGELKRLLKEDGRLIVAVPNCNSLDAKIYGKYWAAYDVPRHLYHFTPENIKHLFGKLDMQIESINPMKFDSFYVSMLSEKYLSRTASRESRDKNNGKGYFFPSAGSFRAKIKRKITSGLLRGILNGIRSNWAAGKNSHTFSSQIYIIKHFLAKPQS